MLLSFRWNESKTRFKFPKTMGYQFRILRRSDSLFLDTSSVSGNYRTTYRGRIERPHLESFRATYSIPYRRLGHCRSSHVPIAQCRFIQGIYPCNVVRVNSPHDVGHIYQYGHATFQNVGRRYGQRTSKRTRLLHIPDSVIFSFYGGAAILILCTLYSSIRVKEMPPAEFRKFHQISDKELTEKNNFISLLRHAPKVFWTVGLVQFFCWSAFMYMWTYSTGAIADNVWHSTDPASPGYQSAGNWTGVLFAIQAIGSVCWAPLLPLIKNRKAAYSLSLLIGGAGFILVPFIHNAYLMFLPFFLIGCAWAAILALPFTILTNSVSGKNMGAYLGLFNGTICVPQILAALVGGSLLRWLGGSQPVMLGISGILLFAGALCVFAIKETFAHKSETERIEKGD